MIILPVPLQVTQYFASTPRLHSGGNDTSVSSDPSPPERQARGAAAVRPLAHDDARPRRASAGSDLSARGAERRDEFERGLINEALALHGGNVRKAARELGMSRTELYKRIRIHGIKRSTKPRAATRATPATAASVINQEGRRDRAEYRTATRPHHSCNSVLFFGAAGLRVDLLTCLGPRP